MNAHIAFDANPITCTHWPPMLAVIPGGNGCRVRCMTCGRTGPERESTNLAWTALMRLRAENGDEGTDTP